MKLSARLPLQNELFGFTFPTSLIQDVQYNKVFINYLKELFDVELEYNLINKQSTPMQGQRVLFLKSFVLTSACKGVNLWYTLIVSNVRLKMRAIPNDAH